MEASSLRTRPMSLVCAVLLLFSTSHALRVTPGSECAAYCLDDSDSTKHTNISTTVSSDIVCKNSDYWSTKVGTKYRTCIDCLQNSTAVSGAESDVSWYLYNIRYAVDVCLFSFPSADVANTSVSSPCSLASNCLPLKPALTTGYLNPENETEFQYCSADNSVFQGEALNNCIQCLQSDSDQTYLSNFLTALSAGCQQQPPVGDVLGLNSTLFTNVTVGVITPAWNQTSHGPATPVTTLSTGTIVGIVLGSSLLMLSAIVLFVHYWRKQRREKNSIRFGDDPPNTGRSRQLKSVSSISGSAIVPFYTTDYKKPTTEQRNFELYDKIKPQYVVVPAKKTTNTAPETSVLWGRDTPMLTSRHLLSNSHVLSPSYQQSTFDAPGQSLDGMPTHPAFLPRAFARGSRNPSTLDSEPKNRVKSNKPDSYAIQRYLEVVDDASTVDVASLISPPLPTGNTQKTVTSITSNPFSPEPTPTLMHIPPPPPGPPPHGSDSSRLTPDLVLPSLSRIRSPKRYIPPPINIAETKPKAHRVTHSDSDESSAK